MSAFSSISGFGQRNARSDSREGGAYPSRHGASLLELIVVLFIIGIMASLLFPALQAARRSVNVNVCQNNVRQLGMGVRRYVDSRKRFPRADQWTIDILKYVEEWDLAGAFANGVLPDMKVGRPKIMHCPEQPDADSKVENVRVCHYVLVVDRPLRAASADKVRWELQDREELSRFDTTLEPWYIGPEISFAAQQKWFADKLGPHEDGTFYDANGQLRGAN
jgi:prepilin-type N-terminal cleavage/methylation domain-containing protein